MNIVTLYGFMWRRGKILEDKVECIKDGHYYKATDGNSFKFFRNINGVYDDRIQKVQVDALESGYLFIYLVTPNKNKAIKRFKEYYGKVYQTAKNKCIACEDQIKALDVLYEVDKDEAE